MGIKVFAYGSVNNVAVNAYCITNASGASATMISYGGRLISLKMPDRNGTLDEVILGYDSLESYVKDTSGQGALIGRYGNRIAGGRFTLDGKTYQLAQNNGKNHLHGGIMGYAARIWDAQPVGENCVAFNLYSPNGEENYPGSLQISVTYTLTEDNALEIHYTAKTDAKTVINLTNHSYFNLSSCDRGTVLNHILQLESAFITEVNDELIPTGKVLPVSPAFDFRNPKPLGQDIHANDEQLKLGYGYDHNFVLSGEGIRRIATLYAPDTGRAMDVITDQCGVQIYTANMFNDPNLPTRGGRPQEAYAAVCLETQHYPDSPNHTHFPSTELAPSEIYDTTTIFRFYTK